MSLRTKKPAITDLAAQVVQAMNAADTSSRTAALDKTDVDAATKALVTAVQQIFPNPVVGNRRLIDLPDGSAVLLYYTQNLIAYHRPECFWQVTRIQPDQRITA